MDRGRLPQRDPYQYAEEAPDDDYRSRLKALIAKARMGDIGISERQRLADALTRIAPSDPLYRQAVEVSGAGPHRGDTPITSQEGHAPIVPDSVMSPGERRPGFPTADFMQGGLGNPMDFLLHRSPPGSLANQRGRGDANTSNTGLTQVSPARAADTQGSAPIGSSTRTPTTALPQTQDPAAADSSSPTSPASDPSGVNSALQYMDLLHSQHGNQLAMEQLGLDQYGEELGAGKWSDIPLDKREEFANDPEAFANVLYEGLPGTAAAMTPFIRSANELAHMGLLNDQGTDIAGGKFGNSTQLALVEQAMQQFDQPGTQFVDPNKIYREIYNRLQNTDVNTMTGDQGGQGGGVRDQIAVSNKALFNAAPYLTDDAKNWLAAKLDAAGMQYMTELAHGSQMTYPQYLNSIHAYEWLAG